MKIRMVSTLAGPEICLNAGGVYELDEVFAKKLVVEGHAAYVTTAKMSQSVEVETADKPMPEVETRQSEEVQVENKRRGRPKGK